MARKSLTEIIRTKNNIDLAAGDIADALKELQGQKVTLVAGANINTNMAVAGIATEDTLAAVLGFKTDAAAASGVINLSAEAAITSAGNIQVTTTDATGYLVLVIWLDKDGA